MGNTRRFEIVFLFLFTFLFLFGLLIARCSADYIYLMCSVTLVSGVYREFFFAGVAFLEEKRRLVISNFCEPLEFSYAFLRRRVVWRGCEREMDGGHGGVSLYVGLGLRVTLPESPSHVSWTSATEVFNLTCW